MDVVVDMLANNSVIGGSLLLSLLLRCRFESGTVDLSSGLDLLGIIVLVDFALNRVGSDLVMLGCLNLLVLQGLNGSVVVVLMSLTVDDSLFLGLVDLLDVLVLNRRRDLLLDGGVLLAYSSFVNVCVNGWSDGWSDVLLRLCVLRR